MSRTFSAAQPCSRLIATDDERDRQHHGRDRGGAGVVVLLQLDDDQERGDLGRHRHVAGDEDHRAVLADGAGEGEREAGEQRRAAARAGSPRKTVCQRLAPSVAAASSSSRSILEHRLYGAHHERQADEDQRDDDAQRRVGDLDAERLEQAADPAVRRIERRQRDAGDRRRQGEGQVDQRVDRRRPGKR